MIAIKRSSLVAYSAHQMFSLVADIEAYAAFLPWCERVHVLTRTEDAVVAVVDIAYHGINKTFTTRNLLFPDRRLEMHLVEGPFRHLQGYWRFDVLDAQSSKIALDLEFEFANKLMDLTLGPLFGRLADGMVQSFERRAAQVYG